MWSGSSAKIGCSAVVKLLFKKNSAETLVMPEHTVLYSDMAFE